MPFYKVILTLIFNVLMATFGGVSIALTNENLRRFKMEFRGIIRRRAESSKIFKKLSEGCERLIK